MMRGEVAKKKVAPYDAAEFLDTDERVAGYLSEALRSNDPDRVALALTTIARAVPRAA